MADDQGAGNVREDVPSSGQNQVRSAFDGCHHVDGGIRGQDDLFRPDDRVGGAGVGIERRHHDLLLPDGRAADQGVHRQGGNHDGRSREQAPQGVYYPHLSSSGPRGPTRAVASFPALTSNDLVMSGRLKSKLDLF